MIKLVDKLIIKELLGPFIFGVLAFTTLFFAGDYLLELMAYLSDGVSIYNVLKMLLYYIPTIVFYTLPMATLLAVIFAIGRVSGESEMTAMFAGGISYKRILVPVLVFCFFAAVLSYCLNDFVAPKCFFKLKELEHIIEDELPTQNKPITIFDKETNSLIRIAGGYNIKEGKALDMTCVQFNEKNEPNLVVVAHTALWQGMRDDKKKFDWKLYDGYTQKLGDEFSVKISFNKSETKDITINEDVDKIELLQKAETRHADTNMNFFEMRELLKYYKKTDDTDEETINKTEVFMWNRFSMPLACFIFGLIAAPLAIRSHRSGAGIGVGISLAVILMYYLVWNCGSNMAFQGSIPGFIGSFGGNILGLIVGIYLNKRVNY
ncbi:MAG: LptF/LptG family permease [Abditibacteriota bacterium]|nr:LptF/LptG family permease [Abditibacteriota bacterium]